MKPDLQRIEAALNQIEQQDNRQPELSTPDHATESDPLTSLASISFHMRSPSPIDEPALADSVASDMPTPLPQYLSLQASQAPALPRLDMSNFEVASPDPGFVLQMIRKFEAAVSAWYAELQQILQRTRAVEAEGPAINGWLESRPGEPHAPSASTLRHADIEELLVYVDQICNPSEGTASPQHHYVLCGHNAEGQVWSRPCGADELSDVSMAIARYQILSQLRDRQECLEKRLNAIATQLTHVYQTYVGQR